MMEEIEKRFKHYPPKDQEQINVHEAIRHEIKQVALALTVSLPQQVINTREFSQVLTDLENAMMHANAAYARHKND